MVQPHNILIHNAFSLSRSELNLLRSRKIHQIFLYQDLRKLIPRHRDHPICADTAILRNADIRGACSDIHESYIEQAKLLWNRKLNRRDRLQSQIRHIKLCTLHSGIEAVNHLLRQKGRQHIRGNLSRLMPLQKIHIIII